MSDGDAELVRFSEGIRRLANAAAVTVVLLVVGWWLWMFGMDRFHLIDEHLPLELAVIAGSLLAAAVLSWGCVRLVGWVIAGFRFSRQRR
jgi:hypothetical protein